MAGYPPNAPASMYGLPFQVPQQPNPQAVNGSGSQQPLQSYPFAGGIPGLNSNAYAQNSEQPQYQPQYWPPPPLPPTFPPNFAGQDGFVIPPPPPIPGMNIYPPFPQLPVQNAPVLGQPVSTLNKPAPNAAPAARPQGAAMRERFTGVVDSDKEDGQVSDSDSPAAGARSQPEPPRSVSQSQNNLSSTEAIRQRTQGSAALNGAVNHAASSQNPRDGRPASSSAQRQGIPAAFTAMSYERKEEEARKFLALMQQNNHGYSAFANEGLDPQLLHGFFREFGLSVDAAPSAPTQNGNTLQSGKTLAANRSQKPEKMPANNKMQPQSTKATVPTATSSQPTKVSIVQQQPGAPSKTAAMPSIGAQQIAPVKTAVQNPPVKSAPSPIDRKDYIARLQAAKLGKQPVSNKATPPKTTPPVVAPPTPSQANPSASVPSSADDAAAREKASAAEIEKARKTELIKQRLEAMKAKQKELAQKQAASQAPKPAPSPLDPSEPAALPSANFSVSTPADPAQMSRPSSFQVPSPAQRPSLSGIPGLFMTSPSNTVNGPKPQSVAYGSQTTWSTAESLHAAASGGEEVSTPRSSKAPFTRPLGQSPHDHGDESMIIEVSDDESEGSEMDVDQDQDVGQSTGTGLMSTPALSRSAQQPVRGFFSTSGHPSRSTSVNPVSSTVSTPPASHTPVSQMHSEELSKKERDIALLKQKIQESTRRKKEMETRKKEAMISSPAPAPKSSLLLVEQGNANAPTAIGGPSNLGQDGTRPSGVINTSTSGTASPASSLPDWRRQRRAEIESGLPSLEAGLANNNARMAQLLKEMEQLKAENERAMQDKANLVQELESLGIDTEGMPHEELQAKKDEIVQQIEAEVAVQEAETALQEVEASVQEPMPPDTVAEAPLEPRTMELQPSTPADEAVGQDSPMDLDLPSDSPVQPTEEPVIKAVSPTKEEPMAVVLPTEGPTTQSLSAANEEDTGKARGDAAELDMVAAAVPPAPSANDPNEHTPKDDDEDFYSPDPDINIPIEANAEGANRVIQGHEALETSTKSLFEEGEVNMSESPAEEEDYEPEESAPAVLTVPPPLLPPSSIQQDIVGSSSASSVSETSDEEGELYEPPDVDQVAVDVQPNPVAEDATTQDPLLDNQDDEEAEAMDLESTSDESSSSDSGSEACETSSPRLKDSVALSNGASNTFAIADDLAPELQLQNGPVIETAVTEGHPQVEADIVPDRFTPYESPLKKFKSYRYHSEYSRDVAGGYLSPTYSHQIDDKKPLCTFEAEGGSCNDPHCDKQHFKDMLLSGDKVLVQLGTANPGKTAEEKQQWNDGLRSVLKQLRTRSIKDPDTVALEIAKYRRQYLKDESRVVSF